MKALCKFWTLPARMWVAAQEAGLEAASVVYMETMASLSTGIWEWQNRD